MVFFLLPLLLSGGVMQVDVDCRSSREQLQVSVGRRRRRPRASWSSRCYSSARGTHVVGSRAAGTASAARGSGAEPVGWTAVFALVQVPLHVPPPAERLAARGASVSAPVDVTVMLERSGMLEDLATLVAAIATHGIRLDVKGFGDTV